MNSDQKRWMEKCDLLWGEIIHRRGKCEVENWNQTKCMGRLEAHHLIGRGNKFTRCDIKNGMLLCSLHHKNSKILSAHGSPKAFMDFLEWKYPARAKYIRDNKHKICKAPDFKEQYNVLSHYASSST